MRRTMLLMATTALALLVAGGVALAATINCPNAPNGVCNGTNAPDTMYGSANVDKMNGYGGADLIYGYGSGDTIYSGNETGWGDKVYGGNGADTVVGQQGNDALYGGLGNDTIDGQRGNDLIQGDYGNDTLSTGPGSDRVNAQDGYRDRIICDTPATDTVYYDQGLDVLVGCRAGLARELPPPEGLFKSKGKVLIKHKGKKVCISEAAWKAHHRNHSEDRLLNPHGCFNINQGSRS